MAPETPSSTPNKDAAKKLRDLAKDKHVKLDISSSEKAPELAYDSAKGDKGLSYLAKRLYEGAGYGAKEALSAALMLSALFVEKTGPDPKLKAGDKLIIDAGKAQLMMDIGGEDGSSPRIVEVQLTEEAKTGAEHTLSGPSLGIPTVDDLKDSRIQRLFTITYDRAKDTGFRALLMRIYEDAGYTIQDSSVVATALWGGFMQQMDRPPQLQEGDRLGVGPDKAVFAPKNGKNVEVRFVDIGLATERVARAAEGKTTSAKNRGELAGEVSLTMGDKKISEAYSDLLTSKIVAIPNALIVEWGPALPGIEFCKVFVNDRFYSVLYEKRAKLYRLVQLNSYDDERVVNGQEVQAWTSDFGVIQSKLG